MSFSSVIGQETAIKMLQGILKTGKIATAYLFSGERGVGKFKTAIAFASALNCESPVGSDSCGQCSSCRKIEAGQHPDLRTVIPENGLISIEEIRTVDEFLSYTPYEGRYKVVIVDDADLMNVYAANAFLKTLEEPPDESIIILVSSRQEMLAETILSRCVKIKFSTLSEPRLHAAADLAGVTGLNDVRLKLAMGRMGQLINEETVVRRDEALDVFEDLIMGKDVPVPKERETIDELIDQFLLFIRDMMVYMSSEDRGALFNVDASKRITHLCKDSDIKAIITVYEHLAELKKRIGYNLNKAVAFNYLSSLMVTLNQKDGVKRHS
jgi:DNA polymerase-3 subunit delta'